MASEIKVDTISEKTSANGVTIDSVSLKDGKVATANSIDSDAYVDGSIDNAHIADDAIDSEHYAAGSIDTAHIADNQITLAKMAGGTDGNIISYDASGDPVAIATGSDGQLLTSTGAGSPPAFEDAPGGGLAVADQWRLHTSRNFSGTSAEVITANLEQTDVIPEGNVGSAMTESSGIFTFPSTGYWWVMFNAQFQNDNENSRYCQAKILTTVDDSTYVVHTSGTGYMESAGGGQYTQVPSDVILDVTDVANIKVKFGAEVASISGTMKLYGSSTDNRTYMTFIKLGDT